MAKNSADFGGEGGVQLDFQAPAGQITDIFGTPTAVRVTHQVVRFIGHADPLGKSETGHPGEKNCPGEC